MLQHHSILDGRKIQDFGRMRGVIVALLTLQFSCTSHRAGTWQERDGFSDDAAIDFTITITSTSSYCGGAEPMPGELERYATPTPLPGKWLYIRKGDTNRVNDIIVDSARTDITGLVHLSLPRGTYSMVFEDKKDKEKYKAWLTRFAEATDYSTAIDKTCLDTWLATPHLVFEIVKGLDTSFTTNVHVPCPWESTPCVGYLGPLPP